MIQIEVAKPADVSSVRRIAAEVFSQYGDYARILPRFFASPGVQTYLAQQEGRVVGFVMIGFIPWSGKDSQSDSWVGDVLALAVVPEARRQRIGTRLMERARELARDLGRERVVREVQLTCARTNHAALAFFARQGFRVIDPAHGWYSGGQAAVRMAGSLAGWPERRANSDPTTGPTGEA